MLRVLGRTFRQVVLPTAQQGQQGFRAFGAASHHDDHDDHDHHGYETTPTVFDRLVTLNVVDLAGKRHSIKALTGQSLSQALIEAGFPKVLQSTCSRFVPWEPCNCSSNRQFFLFFVQTYFFPNMGFYTQHIVSGRCLGVQGFSKRETLHQRC